MDGTDVMIAPDIGPAVVRLGGLRVVLPEWALSDQMNLFGHILDPLALLTPDADPQARLHMAQTLFSAVHGVVLLGLEEKFVGVPPALLDAQIEKFVRSTCAGLSMK